MAPIHASPGVGGDSAALTEGSLPPLLALAVAEGQGCGGPYRGGGIGPCSMLQQHIDDVCVSLLCGLMQGRVATL